jgi:hypothetical protein
MEEVLRDIWRAREQEGTEIAGGGKSCKAMRHIGAEPVDDDLRAAWRDRLEREGKYRAGRTQR